MEMEIEMESAPAAEGMEAEAWGHGGMGAWAHWAISELLTVQAVAYSTTCEDDHK